MHIFFSAGEPSGDEHGAELIEELKQRVPGARFSGFGGVEMEAAGQTQLFRLTDLAIVGFLAIIPLLRKFFALKNEAKQFIRREKPDAVVLIDYPGFNWHVASVAKKAGIPVYYYMPPQLWAWGPWRIRKVYHSIDMILSGLPFEAAWYERHNVDVVRVPHPYFAQVADEPVDEAIRDEIRAQGRVIAILPGSRMGEISKNFPVQLMSMRQLHAKHPDIHFPVACYRDKQFNACQRILDEDIARNGPLPVTLHVDRTAEILEAAEMTLMVSGSVSLEVLARKVPAVVLYRGSIVLWALGHTLITVDHFTLPNLIAGRQVMPEYPFWTHLEKHATSMAYILDRWLRHDGELQAVHDQLSVIADDMRSGAGASAGVDAILSRLGYQANTSAESETTDAQAA